MAKRSAPGKPFWVLPRPLPFAIHYLYAGTYMLPVRGR